MQADKKESQRQLKVGRLLQKEMGDILLREKSTFHQALISVTKVRVSPDLSHARIYLSIFGGAALPEAVAEEVRLHYRELRRKLGERVGKQLRIVPELSFFVDDSAEYMDRITQLLGKKDS